MNRPDHPGRNRGTDPVAPGARLSQTRYTLGGGVDLVLPPGAVHGDPQEVDCQRGREGYKLELTRVYSRTRCLTAAAPGRWTAGVRWKGRDAEPRPAKDRETSSTTPKGSLCIALRASMKRGLYRSPEMHVDW